MKVSLKLIGYFSGNMIFNLKLLMRFFCGFGKILKKHNFYKTINIFYDKSNKKLCNKWLKLSIKLKKTH